MLPLAGCEPGHQHKKKCGDLKAGSTWVNLNQVDAGNLMSSTSSCVSIAFNFFRLIYETILGGKAKVRRSKTEGARLSLKSSLPSSIHHLNALSAVLSVLEPHAHHSLWVIGIQLTQKNTSKQKRSTFKHIT